MTEESYTQNNKSISKELEDLIDTAISGYVSLDEIINKIIEKAKQEDVSMLLVRKLIEFKLRERGLSDRTILRKLPDELKDQSKVRHNFAAKQLTNEDKNVIEESSINIEPIIEKEIISITTKSVVHDAEIIPTKEQEVVEVEPTKTTTAVIEEEIVNPSIKVLKSELLELLTHNYWINQIRKHDGKFIGIEEHDNGRITINFDIK